MTKHHVTALAVLLLACLPLAATAQVFDGLTLYGSQGGRTTYLINNSGQTVHSWTGSVGCAYMAYLMPDSSVWRDDVYSGATMRGAAYGGLIQRYNWDGDIIQSFVWSNANHQQHHDIHPMDNGHVLVVSWERKTQAQAQAMGRSSISGEMWPDEVVEVNPVNDSVVWQWHFWDHLIQDVNASYPNYGVVSQHPELLDINVGTVQGGDWMHCNTVDYNEERDEIVVTSHNLHEFFIIDHSTTTAEAAGHTGGRHGKGGDFLYRWGNPQNYDRGTSANQVFYVVHGGNWIPPGCPGAGDILILNNGDRSGSSNDYSVVTQLTPPLDSNDNYHVPTDSAFGPTALTWSYSNGSSFYSQHLGGAYRLPNGNTFVILGTSGVVDEITPAGSVVWTRSLGGQIGRCIKYPQNFATGTNEGSMTAAQFCQLEPAKPNPFITSTAIRYSLTRRSRVRLAVLDATGRVVCRLADEVQAAGSHSAAFTPERSLASGVYFARLEATPVDGATTRQYVATRQFVKGR
jgi:hypothetical protein